MKEPTERADSLPRMRTLRVMVLDLLCMSPYHDLSFCRALQEIGIDVTLASISFHLDRGFFRRNRLENDPGMLDVVAKLGIASPGLRRVLKFIECCANLAALSVRFLFTRPDVIHVQWTPLATKFPVELWFLRFTQKLGVRIVYSVHNVLPHDTEYAFKERFRGVYSAVDALICHTKASRDMLVSEFGQGPARISVIPLAPNVFDLERSAPGKARQTLSLEDDECIVLFLGAVAPYKGLEFLLEAWSLGVQRARTRARLMIVGLPDPQTARQLEQQIAALASPESVTSRLEFVRTEDWARYHEAADVLVYPYKAITQSGALLSGMNFGKPIIATALPGFMEVLEHGVSALLVQYGDVEAFASALVRLIDDPQERNRLAQGATARLGTMNSWQAVASKTEQVYRRLVELPKLGCGMLNRDLS